VTGSAAVELAIDRGMSQLGVPYSWGGGDENGPTKGIRDGGVADSYGDYNKVGFDCSGLMIYAFAGLGISLPHYTGYQYTAGKQVPSSQMKRGDMIFYGPNASQHVALYLGDGKMLEAPQSGSVVKVSDVRYSGMTPYAVRMVS
jgi:cell wall-associated NlpC family hydrolase